MIGGSQFGRYALTLRNGYSDFPSRGMQTGSGGALFTWREGPACSGRRSKSSSESCSEAPPDRDPARGAGFGGAGALEHAQQIPVKAP